MAPQEFRKSRDKKISKILFFMSKAYANYVPKYQLVDSSIVFYCCNQKTVDDAGCVTDKC